MERLKGKKVLFAQRSANRDGSAISGLMSVNALLNASCEVTVVFGHSGPMLDEYRKLGCDVDIFPHGDWLGRGGILRSLKRVIKERSRTSRIAALLGDRHFDLVYVNSLVSMCFARYARLRRVPCIWHVRELFSDVEGEMTVPSFGGKRLVRFFLNYYGTTIAVNSNAVGMNVLGPRLKNRAEIIYNGVSSDRGEGELTGPTRASIGIPTSHFVIGVPSTLRPMKGQRQIILALPKLLESHPNISVVMAGDHSNQYAEQIRRLVSSLGLSGHVFFAGIVEEMAAFYKMADVICIPSRAEPFGRVAIESFFARRLVVASAVGGLAEIISHGVTGLFYQLDDIQELTSRLSWVVENPSTTRSITTCAFEQAHRRFSETNYCSRVVEVVDRTLSE